MGAIQKLKKIYSADVRVPAENTENISAVSEWT